MDAKHWLRELRAELGRRKLPPLYVERFVGELSDHLHDFLEDRMSTDAKDLHGVFHRLGAPKQVADAAAQEHRKALFSRRHPVLVFVMLPIVALPLLWATSIIAIVAMLKLCFAGDKIAAGDTTWNWAYAAVPYFVVALLVIPIALAAAFFCRVARRSAVSWQWSLVACVLLAVIGGMAMAQFALPTGTSRGTLSFGFGVRANPSASQVLQFLVPLSIGGWAVWRQIKAGNAVQARA